MAFTIIVDGDFGVASVIMGNLRHINYGNNLLPVASNGAGADNTLDLGSSTYKWRNAYLKTLYLDTRLTGANVIGASSIDWGTGTDQVSTDDVPEGSTNKYSQGGDNHFSAYFAHTGFVSTDWEDIGEKTTNVSWTVTGTGKFDNKSQFTEATGVWKAAEDGVYIVTARALASSPTNCSMRVVLNGQNQRTESFTDSVSEWVFITFMAYMGINQTVKIQMKSVTAGTFTGWLNVERIYAGA